MDVFEAIRSRRSIYKFRPEPVQKELLLSVLDAARFAPNHKLTEPWRFAVLGDQARNFLASALGDAKSAKLPDSEKAEVKSKTAASILAKPVIVAVGCVVSEDAGRFKEDLAAVSCAIQNMQLAACAQGLGAQWSTPGVIRRPEILNGLGFDPAHEEIVGLIYIGYPLEVPPLRARKELDMLVRWTE